MLDTKFIRENPERVKEEIKRRNMKIDLDSFLSLDEKKRGLTQKVEALRQQQNEASDKMKTGRNEELIAEMQKIKAAIGEMEPELKDLEEKTKAILLALPNITHESVPIGPDESGNVVVRTVGEKPKFDFQPKEHFDIESVKDLIDSERGAKVSGSRFWYLRGDLARLEFALMQYAFNFYANKGLVPMIVPMLVREEAMYGTGFFPADENEIYRVNPDDDNLFLVGTAEVALAAYHMNENLDFSDGPKKYMGYSSCFRREAGTYGKDMKGILRGHQFNKIEMFVFCKSEESWQWHEKLLAYAEEFLQSLGLCYQVLNMCSGDIGAPNAKKYDIEAWLPGQDRFRETNSCSNDTDFQARRLNCRYTDDQGKKQFVHTINNTGTSDRPLIAILENYQQEDGSVIIPEVLRPIFGKDRIG
ncbi:MAG: serine--tRNA ligase [Candidatus Pacebacteria bacterium]|nr:serine--tRNA ligase [Candidatus Paceibacterota bacterium]